MKTTILLIALVLASLLTQAQAAFAPLPFKGANLILIQTPDSANVALDKIGRALVARGYTIKAFDKQFHTLLTEPLQVRTGAFPTTMTVKAIGRPEGGLLLSGELIADMRVLSPTSENTRVQVQQVGKGPAGYFLMLQQLAEALGAELHYGKR
ncbi:hypothetical protein [Hymenobacter lapidiphilus]|uniref:DUF4252 domain-containing protein n=1 Tax=Hymenobacter lapidiphilus TaxID=2608003 RepID=A0A7Y7PSL0_9BACT|nr:hypothetical protein [Hymenobacter lapidiphilus]NVO33273.1 hypothetical protein [Hymenobacter lapidiphilus]